MIRYTSSVGIESTDRRSMTVIFKIQAQIGQWRSRPKLGSENQGPNWAVETKVQVGQWKPRPKLGSGFRHKSLLFLIVLGTQMLVGLIFLFHLLESRILRLPRGRNGSPNGRRSPGGTTPDGSWGSPGSSPGG